jgi:hypothetical protein
MILTLGSSVLIGPETLEDVVTHPAMNQKLLSLPLRLLPPSNIEAMPPTKATPPWWSKIGNLLTIE